MDINITYLSISKQIYIHTYIYLVYTYNGILFGYFKIFNIIIYATARENMKHACYNMNIFLKLYAVICQSQKTTTCYVEYFYEIFRIYKSPKID